MAQRYVSTRHQRLIGNSSARSLVVSIVEDESAELLGEEAPVPIILSTFYDAQLGVACGGFRARILIVILH